MSKDIKTISFTFSLALSGVASKIIDLDAYKPEGFFSAQASVTGTGTVKLAYAITNMVDQSLFSADTDILVGAVAAAHHHEEFSPKICRYLKITATETGGTNAADVNVALVVQ